MRTVIKHVTKRLRKHWPNKVVARLAGVLKAVDLFVRLLQMEFPEALEHSDIVRALLLQGDPDTMEIAYNWLQGIEVEVEDRKKLNPDKADFAPWLSGAACATRLWITEAHH